MTFQVGVIALQEQGADRHLPDTKAQLDPRVQLIALAQKALNHRLDVEEPKFTNSASINGDTVLGVEV